MLERNQAATPRTEDLLTAYELGLLDDAERKRVEDALLNDEALLEDLYDMAPFAAAIRNEPGRLAAVGREGLSASSSSFFARIFAALQPRVLVPAAMTIAVVLGLIFAPGAETTLQRLASVEPMNYVQLDMRAAAPEADHIFEQAMDSYLAEDWNAAAEGIGAALDHDDWAKHDQALLYMGSALLLDHRHEEAARVLLLAVESSIIPVAQQARWQLVQAHLMLDNMESARSELAGLLDSPVFGDQARALQKALAETSH